MKRYKVIEKRHVKVLREWHFYVTSNTPEGALRQVEEGIPDPAVYMEHDNPTYLDDLSDCLTVEEVPEQPHCTTCGTEIKL